MTGWWHHRMPARAALYGVLLSGLCSCAPAPGPAQRVAPPAASAGGATAKSTRLRALLDRFYEARLEAEPHHAARLGYHAYDGRLPDISKAAFEAQQKELQQSAQQLAAVDPTGLSTTRRLEREVALYEARGQLFTLEQRTPFRDPQYYVSALALTQYVARPYTDAATRARAVIAIAAQTPDYLRQADANLEPSVPLPWLQAAQSQVDGLIGFVRDDVAPAFSGLDPRLEAELRAALDTMDQALTRFAAALQARTAAANDDYALGEADFLRMLEETQGVHISLAELERVGQRDLARNRRALDAAARAIDPDASTDEVVQRVIADRPAPEDAVAVAREQALRARAFVAERGFVSIPSDRMAEVRETPPFMRFNIAFLEGSGPFEKAKLPSFYYITPPDPSWPPERQRAYVPNRASLASITVHELFPGHFLQALHMRKLHSRVLRTFRNYTTSEGWAHYAEELMAEQGFDGVEHFQVGELLMALLRDARFLAAIGLHARGMSVPQAAALFRDQAFADRANAEQQAVRGTFDPMYLSYTLGKLMIMKLRDDYRAQVERRGQTFSLRDFHDRFLSYGAAPIPVIRREILGQDAGPPL